VGDEDLEAVDDLGEGHALVLLPLLHGLGALDEDDEVLALALVVALGLGGVSAHVGCCGGWLGWVCVVLVVVNWREDCNGVG
jgi:hypothetical protein